MGILCNTRERRWKNQVFLGVYFFTSEYMKPRKCEQCCACQLGYSHPLMSHNIQSWKAKKQNLAVECANISATKLFREQTFAISHLSCHPVWNCRNFIVSYLLLFGKKYFYFVHAYDLYIDTRLVLEGPPQKVNVARLFVSNSKIHWIH